MNDTNLCRFQGRIIRKSDLRLTDNQSTVLTVTLEVKSKAVDGSGEAYRRLDFAQIVLWDSLATEVACLPQDSEIEVESRLQTRSFKNRSGGKQYVTEFVATEVRPCLRA